MIGILVSKWTPRFLSWSFQVLFSPSRYGIESSICDNLKHQKRCSEVLFFLECTMTLPHVLSSVHALFQWLPFGIEFSLLTVFACTMCKWTGYFHVAISDAMPLLMVSFLFLNSNVEGCTTTHKNTILTKNISLLI